MTTLNLLGGDWLLSFDDEFTTGGTNRVGLRKLEYVSGPVRTTNEVYSSVADAADEFQAMGFENPMLPTTPNEYTMENFYFIPRSSMNFLREGSVKADWTQGAGNGDGVLRVAYTGGTNFVTGDIGRQVVQGGTSHEGTLLDFDYDQDGTQIAWIRPSTSTDTFSGTGALTATGGTGSTTSSVAGTSGFFQASAIQVIGSVFQGTEVYVLQDRFKLRDWDSPTSFQWWNTDADVSLGIISILVPTNMSGSTNDPLTSTGGIAQGDLEVFARQYSTLYDNFRLNVAAGGFQALPLASANDINNTTGYRSVATTSSAGTFDVGNAVYVGASFATATARGVITAVTGSNPTVTLEYYLIGDLTDFANTDALTEYDFATDADGDASATAGTPAANTGGPTDNGVGEGGTVTIVTGTTSADYDNDGNTEYYSVLIDTQGDVPIAKVYERLKYVTRRGQDDSFWDTTSMSVPGETYRGLEGIFEYDASSGALTQGENISISLKPNFTARLMAQNTADADGDYVSLTDQQTSPQSVEDDDILLGGTSANTVTINAGGTIGIQSVSSPKASPFGTFTGSQIFGAPGVRFTNPGTGDAQNYILTDDRGNLRQPPNTVTVAVENTRAGDRILIARDTGTGGIIDKDQFGGMDTPAGTYNGQGDAEIRAAGTVDSEVPDAGFVRVVETTLQQEHRYVYSSVTKIANGVFTLTDGLTGATADAGTNATTIVDAGVNFTTSNVTPGMLIRVTSGGGAGEIYEVVSVDSATQLTVQELFGTGGGLTTGSGYEINRLIQDYATSDNLYDLIVDEEEDTGTDGTPGTASNTLIKTPAANFGVVINVRQGKIILPFTQNGTVGDNGLTATVVRQPDTIAT